MFNTAKTIYVAGPMRGYADFNFPAFDRARDMLIAMGYTVISPADLDRAADITETSDFSKLSPSEYRKMIAACIQRDCDAICDRVDGIYFMRGWEKSSGSAVEWALGKYLGLEFAYEA